MIEAEPKGVCALCLAHEETRPYGPKGEEVCFECGMKDEAAAERGFEKLVMGNSHEQDRKPPRRGAGK